MMSRKFIFALYLKLFQTIASVDDSISPLKFFSSPRISNMNHLNLITLSLVLVISSFGVWAAPASGDSELHMLWTGNISLNSTISEADSMKDLYEYLLQRETFEPLSLDHQMERKAVRSPSMRLRFGRRSDPDVPLIRRVRGRTRLIHA